MNTDILTQKFLKSILDYNPISGVFIWRTRPRTSFLTDRGYNSLKYSDLKAGIQRLVGMVRNIGLTDVDITDELEGLIKN